VIVCYTRWRYWPIICGFSAFFNREPQQWICAINVEFNNSSCTWDVRRHRVYYRGLRVTLIAAYRVTAVQAYWHFQYHRHSQLPTFPVWLTFPVSPTFPVTDIPSMTDIPRWRSQSCVVTCRSELCRCVLLSVTYYFNSWLCVNLLRCGDAFSLSLRLYLRVSYRPICFVYKAKVIWFDTLVGLRPEFSVTSRFAYKLPNCWSQPTVWVSAKRKLSYV